MSPRYSENGTESAISCNGLSWAGLFAVSVDRWFTVSERLVSTKF